MVEQLKTRIVRWLAKDYVKSLEVSHETKMNQRVAKIIADMDPFEPLMNEFHGIFSEEFTAPEDNLDYPGQLRLYMWGWQQHTDPHFHHLMNWIMNTQGNETLKHAPVTTDRILYGRAQLSTMLLFKKEVERLSNHYLEEKAKLEGTTYDETLVVEDD